MMFFKKLVASCYRFQERVGNGDKPVFMSMGMILFAVYLYLTSILVGVSFYWVNIIGNRMAIGLKTLMFCNIIICCLFGRIVYLKYLKNNRLNQTLSIRISKSDKIGTVIFIIGSIISLCGVIMFMWAVNNGFIIRISEGCVHSSSRQFI